MEVANMKVVGLITEYNPFHLGHKYHLNMSKKIDKFRLFYSSNEWFLCPKRRAILNRQMD